MAPSAVRQPCTMNNPSASSRDPWNTRTTFYACLDFFFPETLTKAVASVG